MWNNIISGKCLSCFSYNGGSAMLCSAGNLVIVAGTGGEMLFLLLKNLFQEFNKQKIIRFGLL